MYEQPYNPFQRNIAIIKDYFKSPSVLVLAILQIVSIILSFVQSFVSLDLTREITSKLLEYLNENLRMSDQLNIQLPAAQDASSGISVTFSIPVISILIAVALLLIYFKSRSTNPMSAPTAGFTILNVLAILYVIGAVIATVLLLLVPVVLFVAYAEFKRNPVNVDMQGIGRVSINADAFLILAIVLSVIIVAVVTYLLIYVISYKRYIGSVRNSMKTVELSRSGAKAFGVLCVISAVFGVLSLLSGIFNAFVLRDQVFGELGIRIDSDMTVPMIFNLLTQAVAVAVVILRAKIALGYAKYIDSQKYGYNEPSPSGSNAPYVPLGVGVGSSSQPNPYTYLTQKDEDMRTVDVTHVNPYMDDFNEQRPMVCPSCGAPVDGNAPFCGRCGSKLS